MIPTDEALKLAYYKEFTTSGMGRLAPAFGWGEPHGPKQPVKEDCK